MVHDVHLFISEQISEIINENSSLQTSETFCTDFTNANIPNAARGNLENVVNKNRPSEENVNVSILLFLSLTLTPLT